MCTYLTDWTVLVSPVIAESLRIGPAVTADTHLTSWHTADTTHPQLSSPGTFTFGSEMKEYAGGFSDCDRIQDVWRIDAVKENWLIYPSVSSGEPASSSNPSSSPVSRHFYRAHSLFPDAKK